MPKQLTGLPEDATHLVLSVGGNDLLGCEADILRNGAAPSPEVFVPPAAVIDGFEGRYRRVLEACLEKGLPLVVCTIYNGNFAGEPEFASVAQAAVAAFDEVILRLAREKGVRAIDLRQVCARAEDYANPIEPSVIGGGKIARAIRELIGPV